MGNRREKITTNPGCCCVFVNFDRGLFFVLPVVVKWLSRAIMAIAICLIACFILIVAVLLRRCQRILAIANLFWESSHALVGVTTLTTELVGAFQSLLRMRCESPLSSTNW